MANHRVLPDTCLGGEPRPRWSRRKRFLVLGLPILTVLLVAGVAIAAILLRAPITGGGTAGQLTLSWGTAPSVMSGPCTTSMSADKKLTINFTNVVAGDSCKITGATVEYTLTRDMVVNPPKYISAPGITLKFASTSVLQEGLVLAGDGNPGSKRVDLDLTFGPGLVLGQTYTADTDAGITVSEVAP